MYKVTISEIEEELFDLDTEYRESLAKGLVELKYLSDTPLKLSYGTDKQQKELEKVYNRKLNSNEIIEIIEYMLKDMKGDFQYHYFNSIAKRYLDIAKEMQDKEKDKLNFYTEEEIKKLINSKSELYFADDGLNEVIIRLEDIPDYIVDTNEKNGFIDLKFYSVDKTSTEPDIKTIGEFLDKISPELREKIINRLVKLQKREIKPKNYKIINEYKYEKVKEKLNKQKKERKKHNREER